jgi:Na+-transporting methylmalonyl-CoA/oxaloacetate decarboxylase gamma subunit
MLSYGLLITFIGMGAVFGFLYLLMLTIQLASKFIQKKQVKEDDATIALAIAVALKQGGK